MRTRTYLVIASVALLAATFHSSAAWDSTQLVSTVAAWVIDGSITNSSATERSRDWNDEQMLRFRAFLKRTHPNQIPILLYNADGTTNTLSFDCISRSVVPLVVTNTLPELMPLHIHLWKTTNGVQNAMIQMTLNAIRVELLDGTNQNSTIVLRSFRLMD